MNTLKMQKNKMQHLFIMFFKKLTIKLETEENFLPLIKTQQISNQKEFPQPKKEHHIFLVKDNVFYPWVKQY